MAVETIEQPKSTRLELHPRNELQKTLMKMKLGENPAPTDEVEWVMNYGRKVSDIIDSAAGEPIRELARQEKYSEAAEKVLELLRQ